MNGLIQHEEVAQWWRILLPKQEMQVLSLDQEDLLEEEMATHSTTYLENPTDRGASVHGVAKSWTQLSRHA